MGQNYECFVAISADVPHKSIKNPAKWLGDMVFRALKKYDDSLTRDSLNVELSTETEKAEGHHRFANGTEIPEKTEGQQIDALLLECEHFNLGLDYDQDGDKILKKIVKVIKKRLNKKGATGRVNISGYLFDRPPEISAYAILKGTCKTAPTQASQVA